MSNVAVSVVLPISRREYLLSVFECLNALQRPDNTELILMLQGERGFMRDVERLAENLNYELIHFVDTRNAAAITIADRRWNIAQVHNIARHLVQGKYVLSVEDDTTFPSNALEKMLDTFERYEDCGFVEGVQLGRHNTPYVGAWKVDNVQEPSEIKSVKPSKNTIESIDAGGLYCALTKAELYRSHTFSPYDTIGKNGLGCDVNYGLDLRQEGYSCFIDWSIECGHLTPNGTITIDNTVPAIVTFSKIKEVWECKRT